MGQLRKPTHNSSVNCGVTWRDPEMVHGAHKALVRFTLSSFWQEIIRLSCDESSESQFTPCSMSTTANILPSKFNFLWEVLEENKIQPVDALMEYLHSENDDLGDSDVLSDCTIQTQKGNDLLSGSDVEKSS